jgi:predicted acylesterase/phospholipase RssA
MFGSYQAGVWSVLAEHIKPDLVVGASVGSLNGWLIAGGCSPDSLVEQWCSPELASPVKWRMPKHLFDGVIANDVVDDWIQRIHDGCTPTLDYALVATELRTMRPTIFRGAGLTWQHLAASCGVPLFLRQHRIGGVLYGDGGLIDPLPLWAALELGATRIVTVNLLPRRPFILRAVSRCAQVYGRFRNPTVEGVQVVNIIPTEELGTAADTIYWKRANAERWIALGKKDAYSSKHLVVECFERQGV